MGMPDATLGRIQGSGYNNQIEAIERIKKSVNDSIAQQMQIISSWRDREEGKAERERQREWNEQQAKLSREHASDEAQKSRDFTQSESQKGREHTTSENAKDRANRKAINDANNLTQKIIANKDYNQAVYTQGWLAKGKKGEYLINAYGMGELTPAGKKAIKQAQEPTQNQDLPMQRN